MMDFCSFNAVMLKHYTSILASCGTQLLRTYRKKAIDETKKKSPKRLNKMSKSLLQFLNDEPQLTEVVPLIPAQYFTPYKKGIMKNLYLIDSKIAKEAVVLILPLLHKKTEIICETNSGLGLITSELLSQGIKYVRLYEACDEFQKVLMNLVNSHPNQVELFPKNIYYLNSLSYLDRVDHGNRVESLLKGVPKITWKASPVMTIIGPSPNISFINYLIKMLVYQAEIITYGRVQLFTFMEQEHYMKLTAKSGDHLRRYSSKSILFQLFFDSEVLGTYSRKYFLPWESKTNSGSEIKNDDSMYLVHINFKKVLPTETQHLMHLYYFVKQAFGRGRPKIIPTIEKWFPGVGMHLIVPQSRGPKVYKNMDIFTEFRQLSPEQILQVFRTILQEPNYKASPFLALADSLALKFESIRSEDNIQKKK